MEKNDAYEFANLMAGLGELYGKSFTKPLNEIYWRALNKYEIKTIKVACHKHVNDPDIGQFMPKPADIIRAIEGDTTTQSKIAWSKVEKAIREKGPYKTVVFDDPIIHAVIESLGGWIKLGHISEKELSFLSHDFEKRYRGLIKSPPAQIPRQLTGIVNHQNLLSFGLEQEPEFLGDQQKARQLYQQPLPAADTNFSLTFHSQKELAYEH